MEEKVIKKNIKYNSIGICRRCGFRIKLGEWYATPHLHFFCASSKDIRQLREEGRKKFEEGRMNSKRSGMGSHFGGKYNGFCLEF